MTLQEKLEVRRNAARNMKPVNSPERIWEYIRLELLGFTSIELLSGKVICVDVEVKDGQVLITKYILDSETDVKMIAKIPLDRDFQDNLEKEMRKVLAMAEKEEIEWIDDCDGDYKAWGFTMELK